MRAGGQPLHFTTLLQYTATYYLATRGVGLRWAWMTPRVHAQAGNLASERRVRASLLKRVAAHHSTRTATETARGWGRPERAGTAKHARRATLPGWSSPGGCALSGHSVGPRGEAGSPSRARAMLRCCCRPPRPTLDSSAARQCMAQSKRRKHDTTTTTTPRLLLI